MTPRMTARSALFVFAVAGLLSGCGPKESDQQNLDTLDAELANSVANGRDPVVAAALQDQIMVDPALAGQANDDAIRPPNQPLSGAIPPDMPLQVDGGELPRAPAATGDCPECRAARQALTLGALAKSSERKTPARSCATDLTYSAAYAARLPAGLPVYPDGRVAEAAGNDANGCAFRAISFISSAPPQRLLDWYSAQGTKAGYKVGHQAEGNEHVLAGTKDRAAFTLFVSPRGGGGSTVDLLANTDR